MVMTLRVRGSDHDDGSLAMGLRYRVSAVKNIWSFEILSDISKKEVSMFLSIIDLEVFVRNRFRTEGIVSLYKNIIWIG